MQIIKINIAFVKKLKVDELFYSSCIQICFEYNNIMIVY